MGKLKTLVFMQLKDKIDFSFIKSKQKTIFKIVFSILKFVIITSLIYAAFYLLSFLRLVSLLDGIPVEVLTIIFTVMFSLSILSCTFGLMKSLYFSLDNRVLLTFPTSRSTMFISKIIVYYIYELIRNVTFLLPLFIAYALVNKYPFYFYFWLIFVFMFITAVPVVIGALLSIPAMYISNFIKKYKWLEFLVLAIFVGLVTWGLVALIGVIPENFDLIGSWGTTFWQLQELFTNFVKTFAPFYWVVLAIVGVKYGVKINVVTLQTFINFVGIVAFIAIMLGLIILIVKPLFFHMVSIPFEFSKNVNLKPKQNKKSPAFWSAVKKEILLNYRTQNKLFSLIYVVIGTPLTILLLNKIYSAMDTRLSGAYMAIAFNVLMILLIVCSSNSAMAKVFSEEGASAYLNKTNPKPFIYSLTAKIIINAVLLTISIAVSVGVFASFCKIAAFNAILMFLGIEAIYLGHLLYSAQLDIMNPFYNQVATTGEVNNNPNETKSVLVAFAMSAFIALITYFLIAENANVVWVKLMFIGFAYLTLQIYGYINKIKIYYKEK